MRGRVPSSVSKAEVDGMSRFVSSAGARSGMVPPSARDRGYADGLAGARSICHSHYAFSVPGALNALTGSSTVLRASIRGRLLVHWYNMASEHERRAGDGGWLKASAENPRHGSVRGATRLMSDSCNVAMPDRRTRWTSIWSATRVTPPPMRSSRRRRGRCAWAATSLGMSIRTACTRRSYSISRILRSGQNEFLIYLKPLVQRASAVL